jgi:hypothetical protein
MIEFVMVLPLIFILLFAIFEWSQIFIKHSKASTINREAALAMHHECKKLDDENALACVRRIRQETINKAGALFSEFNSRGEIILSLYTETFQATSGGGTGYASHFNSTNIDASLIESAQSVAISEFFYDNRMVTPLEKFFNFVMPRLIYKSTIV